MKISLSLSKKKDADGLQELMLTAQPVIDGRQIRLRAKSGIKIKDAFFDSKRDNGIKSMSRMLKSQDVTYHKEQEERISNLLKVVSASIEEADGTTLSSEWLQQIVDKTNHPERFIKVVEKVSIYDLVEQYIAEHKSFSESHTKHIKTAFRHVSRYERFIKETDDKNFSFNIDTVTRETIADFRDYLRNEYDLMQKMPKIFEKILADTALPLKRKQKIERRGENAIVKILKLINAFFNWAVNEAKCTKNKPFEGYIIGSERFGDPFYISIEERNQIATATMPTKHLETQRDIFIFQCFIGCRVGDLQRLTKDNVEKKVLTYAPHKTKDEGEQAVVAVVPLVDDALALIKKYKGKDKQGRLFPFISTQKYNDAIKEIFKAAKVTRKVVVRNALTGENEIRPINEVASSHMARRAFCGNLYKHVQDPNLIGKMSGHTDGSRAFKRYRKVETDTLREVVKNLIQ